MRSVKMHGAFWLVGLLLFGLLPTWLLPTVTVQGFSLITRRSTVSPIIADTKGVKMSWMTELATMTTNSPTKSSVQLEESKTKDHVSSATLTKTQVAAWCLSQQLLSILQQEELSWRINDDIEERSIRKLPQMIRWLNTRLLFGCTALEHVQQAATATATLDELSSSNTIATSEQDQKELQAMLDFSEFDLPYLEDDDYDGDLPAVLDDTAEVDTIVEELDSKDDSSAPSSETVVIKEDLSQASSDTIQLEQESIESSAPPFYNFGRPLEIVQSNVPPLQQPIKETSMLFEETYLDENKNGETMKTTDTGATDNLKHQKETTSDSVQETKAVSIIDNKESMDSSGNAMEPSSTLVKSSGEDQVDVDLDVEMNGSRDTTVIEESVGMNETMTEYRVETVDESVAHKAKTTSEQERLYKASALISHSFEAREFIPPIWTRNGNVQTIGSFLARERNPALIEFQWDERQQMETPDGDFFVVDWKYSDMDENVGRPSNEVPLVLLCHGLQSNSDSYLAKDMARAFNSVGMDVACINFRGCSDETNRGPLGYHLGFTDDLLFMLEHLSDSRGGSKLYLSGFSLGANVVTKLLAELGTNAYTKYNVRGAAVNALPFNFLKIGPNFSDDGLTKSLYGDGLLKSLQETVLADYDDQNYTFSKEQLMNLKTVREFDDLVVCDVYDFDDVDDYHRKCSTINVLDQVAVPELVIQALDDPFFQGNTNPPNNPSQPLRVQYTEHGGHCGYWQNEAPDSEATWMPLQLARFLKHVDAQQSALHEQYRVVPNDLTYTASTTKQGLEKGRRQLAVEASHTFQIRDYRPASYATNPHLQTVMGALYRKETMYASPDLISFVSGIPKLNGGGFQWDGFHWDRRQRIETPDNDFFEVDWKTSGVDFESDNTPLVIICHGLQASSDSPLVKDMAVAFLDHGMGAACINFRGCAGEVNLTPRGYHLGFTEDLQQLVLHVNAIYPNRRIYLSAFSLGANVVTTFLAKLGSDAAKHNIAGAAVNALPYEVSKSTMNLNSDGLTKTLYADRILESMYVRIEEMFDNGVEFGFEREKVRECKTIMDMENLVVAPFFGFKDAWDYYDKTCTLPHLDDVGVPQLVIQSEDDPFLLGQSYVEHKADRPLRIHYTKYGGHCGHVLHCTDRAYPTSWMPTELARFLAHVDLSLKSETTARGNHRNKNAEKEILN